MRIVFGIMSAVHGVGTVAQLVRALAPHPVVIHHDFSQQPEFEIREPNVRFVSDPKQTGWGVWGFSEGIFHLLDDCLSHSPFDYLQLLSPTCLPIRPLREFEDHLRIASHDAHIDAMSLDDDPDALVHYGWRAFYPQKSLRFYGLRTMFAWYAATAEMKHQAGLCVMKPIEGRGPGAQFRLQAVRWASRAARAGLMGPTPFSSRLRPFVGSTWFGARPDVCRYLVDRSADPVIVDHFRRLEFGDEVLFPTLLNNSGFRIGPANHEINRFIGSHPGWISPGDLDDMDRSGRFFGRKFGDDPDDPVRLAVVDRLRRAEMTTPK